MLPVSMLKALSDTNIGRELVVTSEMMYRGISDGLFQAHRLANQRNEICIDP